MPIWRQLSRRALRGSGGAGRVAGIFADDALMEAIVEVAGRGGDRGVRHRRRSGARGAGADRRADVCGIGGCGARRFRRCDRGEYFERGGGRDGRRTESRPKAGRGADSVGIPGIRATLAAVSGGAKVGARRLALPYLLTRSAPMASASQPAMKASPPMKSHGPWRYGLRRPARLRLDRQSASPPGTFRPSTKALMRRYGVLQTSVEGSPRR